MMSILPKKDINISLDSALNMKQPHGIFFDNNMIRLYEYGQKIESMMPYENDKAHSLYLLHGPHYKYRYVCYFEKTGLKDAHEYEEHIYALEYRPLWFIYWRHGTALRVDVYGDLSKSKLPKELLPPELFRNK